MKMKRTKLIIMGAAGRDFHNFNVCYRDNEAYEVVAFTATQIPNIESRRYPPVLAGSLYPEGIPIYPEEDLLGLINKHKVDEVIFSYSDISHNYVMHKASQVMTAGANFTVLGSKRTMIKSSVPVVAVCAVRTGCGKSAASRRVCKILRDMGKKIVVVRHPMPYGDLAKQRVQRFSSYDDLVQQNCTIEEMEEYAPHVDQGTVVYAGVDYAAIVSEAEKEADIIVWDGGNNDMPFIMPDLLITLVDPHRAGDELTYYPGETNLLMANVIVVSKVDTATPANIESVKGHVKWENPDAIIIDAALPVSIDNPDTIKGKCVLAIEDGPTLTHGGMGYGAATIAANKYGAELVDPREYAVGSIFETFEKFPNIGNLLPAMGYSVQQIKDLEETVNLTECDAVIIGTPVDLTKVIKINKPSVRALYDIEEIGKPDLTDVLERFRQ